MAIEEEIDRTADNLATALTGIGAEQKPERGQEESLNHFRQRLDAWQRRRDICEALVEFGRACAGVGR